VSKVFVLQHIACEGLGILEEVFQDREMDYRYIRLYQGEALPSPEDVAESALIILGGPMNVYEEDVYPYLKAETELIRYGLSAKIPMIGICLGAQMIAHAAGARIYPGQTKEIGWYPIQMEAAAAKDELFSLVEPDNRVFQWHGDTFDLPAGAVHLASSNLFPHQAFRLNNNVYALQFHLEVTRDMVINWVDEYREEVKSEGVDVQRYYQNTDEEIENLNKLGNKVFTAFSEHFLESESI
jgi:GMP synthase (glutamine-hydrolysing)